MKTVIINLDLRLKLNSYKITLSGQSFIQTAIVSPGFIPISSNAFA
jgi:hypothetical protein